MFPIRDHNPATRTPFVNFALIAINVVVFLFYLPLFPNDAALGAFFQNWAITPIAVTNGVYLHTLITSMFLHGGWMHLLGNMLFLFIFGDNLEDQLGHVGYLLFYLACGVGAGLIQVISDPYSVVPIVGASGAIAGVMGGYLLMFPKARVDILLFLIIIIRVFPVPAWGMLGVWFGLQLFNGTFSSSSTGGVAYWAHAGGFILGFVLMLPVWFRRGGPAFWKRTHGHPDHPEAHYKIADSSVPRVRRNAANQGQSRVPKVRRRR